MKADMEITRLSVYTMNAESGGGDYFRQKKGHWLIDTIIANPMSGYEKYKASRSSWGVSVLGSIIAEIETRSGHTGVATGFGGIPAAWLIENRAQGLLGPLSGLLRVHGGFEAAVATALGPLADAVAADTGESAHDAIRALKAADGGRVALVFGANGGSRPPLQASFICVGCDMNSTTLKARSRCFAPFGMPHT